MKDIETAIQEVLKRQGKGPSEITELVLDSKCKSTHVKGLDGFTNLQTLSLASIGLTSLEGFPRLPKLVRLTLAENRFSGGLQHLAAAGLTNLKKLDLAGTRIAKLSELEPLKQLKNLSNLELLGTPLANNPDYKDQVFKMLDEIKYLDTYDRTGAERDADDEEDDAEEGEGEEYEEEGGEDAGEGEEEFEEEGEGEEFEEGEGEIPEYAALVGEEPLEDDEQEYEGEEEGDDDDEDEEEEEAGASAGGVKRKREEEEEEDEEDDE